MDEEAAEQLAFDVACAFFSDEQICTRYELTPKQLENVKGQPAFLALVDENRRLLEDDGSEFLIKAKRYASDALDVLHDIAQDDEMSGMVRHKCAVSVLEYARVRTGGKSEGGDRVAPIIINTNLNLGAEKKGLFRAKATMGKAAPKVIDGKAERVAEDNKDLLG